MAEIAYEALFEGNKGATVALTVKRPEKTDVKWRKEMDEKNEKFEKDYANHIKQSQVNVDELIT